MEFQVPEWLTKEFMQKTLEHGKKYKVKIEEMKIDMPVPKGNNYSTDIYGVHIKYEKSNDSNKSYQKLFIIKSPIKGPMTEELKKYDFYQKEPMAYNVLLPKLKPIFGENEDDDNDSIDDDDSLFPKSYFSDNEDVVILEDLKIKGYVMVDRQKQLDYKHCVLALKALAKFHAGTIALHEKEPECIETVGKEFYFYSFFQQYAFMFVANLKLIGGILKDRPDDKKYAKWFEESSEKVWEYFGNELQFGENDFKVLNHGDFWLCNILFKYNDENEPVKVKPIDLQVCRYSSPAFDLTYFMDTSVQENIRDNNYDDLLNVYVNELNSHLEKYDNPKRLQILELKSAMKRLQYYRLFINLTTLAGVLADPKQTKFLETKDIDMEDLKNFTETSPFLTYYKNEKYLNIFSKRIEEFVKDGVISVQSTE